MDAYLIMDGQWGSCGKGLLAGKLALDRCPDVTVCNFGPNAGHTFIDKFGQSLVTRQLPTGLVNEDSLLLLGPGAIIDPLVLAEEIDRFSGPYLVDRRLMIHERAAIVLPQDKDAEARLLHIASTRKGVGAAIVRKLMRNSTAQEPAIARDFFTEGELASCIVDDQSYRDIVSSARLVQIESAQGLELSLNHGSHYPYCTSRDVTPEAILNDVGVPLRHLLETCVVVRTYPIRVGNEFTADGQMVGTSGPVYADMAELTWTELSKRVGRELLEKTTVTGKVRRVFTWSPSQFESMLRKLSPCQVMVNFCNYLHPTASSYAQLDASGQRFLQEVAQTAWQSGSELQWLGFGPGYNDVQDYEALPGLRLAA